MTNLDNIMSRIQRLRAISENAASSQQEVETSIRKAAMLMEQYQIEEVDLAMNDVAREVEIVTEKDVVDISKVQGQEFHSRKPARHHVFNCLFQIEQMCGVKIVIKWSNHLDITGEKKDVAMAQYLIEVIRNGMEQSYAEYKRVNVAVGRGAKASFMLGFSDAINSRLRQMVKERNEQYRDVKEKKATLKIADKELDTSTDLVLVNVFEKKMEEVKRQFRQNNPRLGKAKSLGGYASNGNSYGGGRASGNKLSLNKAVKGGAPRALLK